MKNFFFMLMKETNIKAPKQQSFIFLQDLFSIFFSE